MKLPEIFKQDYVQSIIMIIVVIFGVLVFWYGLKLAYNIENPMLAVASGSMRPVLDIGDLILVEGIRNISDIHAAPADAQDPGDIVVYQGTRELIVHRAINKTYNEEDETWSFTTKGDNNSTPDPRKVTEDKIVGKYTGFKIPWLGNIALWFADFEVKVAFVALWIILLFVIEVVPLLKKGRQSDNHEASLYK